MVRTLAISQGRMPRIWLIFTIALLEQLINHLCNTFIRRQNIYLLAHNNLWVSQKTQFYKTSLLLSHKTLVF
jgi:hypothetical protein